MARIPFKGLNVTDPLNRIRAGFASVAVNIRQYLGQTAMLRNLLSGVLYTLSAAVVSVSRLNDSTPSGPVSGFALISVDSAGNLWLNGTKIATGLTGNPVSISNFRPNTSVKPWAYVWDSAPDGNVTITTKKAIDGTATTFVCGGSLKVRSDGLVYKTGVKEPQSAPVVGIQTTTVTQWLTLPANTPPWTNIGGVNANHNYTGTDDQPPYPTIIATPIAGSTVVLTVTGTATVNGATHAPGDVGPATAGYPGDFIVSPLIVVFAFTDANGNIIAQSTAVGAPPVVGNVGAAVTLTVPSGATQIQVGIDSQGGHFSSNAGSYLIQAVVSTNAITLNTAIVGAVTAYVWGDSPHSGPVASYIWKNSNDGGTGTPRSISNAQASATNNSLIFDSTPEDPTVPVQWTTLDAAGSTVGTIPLFSPALETEGYQDFNVCVAGSIFFPQAGSYTVQIQNKDQILFGMGGGITSPNQPTYGPKGQSITVADGLPLVYVSVPNGSGGSVTQSFAINVPAMGVYSFEGDWVYWYHTGRSFIIKISPTPGAAVALVPPLPQGVRTNVSYGGKYRSSVTGAGSNPGPTSTPQVTPVLANTIMMPYSPDPQVDKWDAYRQDASLANYTYVATGPNDGLGPVVNGIQYNTPIVDTLSDLGAANNATMNYDDYEPVPSIDTPKSGYVTIVGGVITSKSGDQFNTRWLAGTVIEIGSPTQLAYMLVARPISTTQIIIPGIADTIGDAAGDGVPYNIAEPILAAQPLAYVFGPTDNINFAHAVGDSLRPGTDYWSKGNNLDSWPQTNQRDVTDPSEALVNGAMSSGLAVLNSIKRAWVILPNQGVVSTATGDAGDAWTFETTSINRGLYMPRCLYVEGGGRIFMRVQDGIQVSMRGSAGKSITDDTLYPLFPHEGSVPTSITRNGVTFYPPDDTNPETQQFSGDSQFMYYDYKGIDSTYHTLVFDIQGGGWVWDMSSPKTTIHASNLGQSEQGVLAGCVDSTIRDILSVGATETATATLTSPAFGGRGFGHMGQFTVEYSSNGPVTLLPIAVDVGNGSYYGGGAITLPSTGGIVQKLKINPSPNKGKLFQLKFSWSDSTAQIYLPGVIVNWSDWDGSYRPIEPFTEAGGVGGEL